MIIGTLIDLKEFLKVLSLNDLLQLRKIAC